MVKWEENKYYTPEEYFRLVEELDYKIEYHQGRIYDMAGGTANHCIISANLIGALHRALTEKDCVVFTSDMQLAVEKAHRYVYPDAMVTCGEPEYRDDRQLQLINPLLVAEVQSPGTRNYDKLLKFPFYRALPSFREFILLDSQSIIAETYFKEEDDLWRIQSSQSIDGVLHLHSLGIDLKLADLYRKTDLNKNRE